jgi:hypothetical protein
LALIAGAVLMTSDAQAGFFSDAATRFMNTFKSVRTMVLIFGGFGLIVLAVAAILGKIKWAALGALAAGLAIVAVAGKVVDWATQGEDPIGASDLQWNDLGGTTTSSADTKKN